MSKLIAGKIDLYDVTFAFGWKLNLRDTFTCKLVNEPVRFNIMFILRDHWSKFLILFCSLKTICKKQAMIYFLKLCSKRADKTCFAGILKVEPFLF